MKRFAGSKPIKQLTIKVFAPQNKVHKTYYLRAKSGNIFTPEGIEYALQQFAGNIEKAHPYEEYSLKQISPRDFNFVWIGKKPVDEAAIRIGGMELGETATVEVGS